MKEFKVGEYFYYCGKKYIVVEDATGNCGNCAFWCPYGWCANATLRCKSQIWIALLHQTHWDWTMRDRSDNKCVIFKEVKE